MEGSSNSLLSASSSPVNSNVSNFVSVKLSGKGLNYHLWKAQMLCLLDTHNMRGIVDSTSVGPGDSSMMTVRQYDSLVKGWIFGSICEDVLIDVYNLDSAKAVWDKLKSMYDTTMSLQQVSAASRKSYAQTETKDIDTDPSKTINTTGTGEISVVVVPKVDVIPSKNEDVRNTKELKSNLREALIKGDWLLMHGAVHNMHFREIKEVAKEELRELTIKGDWSQVEFILKYEWVPTREAIKGDGSMILHTAVGSGHNYFVKSLLPYLDNEEVLTKRNSDGSTALHIAAIVGNKDAAELLIKKNKELLKTADNEGKEPLHKACEHMHLDITEYLLKAVTDDGETSPTHALRGVEIGDLLANAFSAKNYNLASKLVKNFPHCASRNDEVLMAIAKTFPTELNTMETLVYPKLDMIWLGIIEFTIHLLTHFSLIMKQVPPVPEWRPDACNVIIHAIIKAPLLLILVVVFVILPMLMAYMINLPYYLLWKATKILGVPTINRIEIKKKEWDDAKKILVSVCDQIDDSFLYTRPFLEAACQNAYRVVDEILFRSPDAIKSTNESGYDIIHLAMMHRSEKIYNLIYDIGERRNLYRTKLDSSKNNILHLAGRLAPSLKLNCRTGAALQLQLELQWFEEVKKLVFPTYITQENIFKETPNMVFTKEHQNMLKEGEQWMKITSESCSITAALITTVVFAAAITVPGGNHQEKGTPLFRGESAFTIFAISDAISLFASSTALLVFLSILTARFAETDFLVSLPRRLFIGLFTLLLSTITMMVAFGASLFLVFCDKKPWMLAPICGLAFIPIASFVTLQFPLMVDLFASTQIRTFGKQRRNFLKELIKMTFLMGEWLWHKGIDW